MKRQRIAFNLKSDITVVFLPDQEQKKKVDAIISSLSEFVDLITVNENLECFNHKRVADGKVVWSVAISDHEAKAQILLEVVRKIEKYCAKFKIEKDLRYNKIVDEVM